MTLIEQAQALLQLDPLPVDIEAQIEALYAKVTTDEERFEFGWIFEALTVALNPASD